MESNVNSCGDEQILNQSTYPNETIDPHYDELAGICYGTASPQPEISVAEKTTPPPQTTIPEPRPSRSYAARIFSNPPREFAIIEIISCGAYQESNPDCPAGEQVLFAQTSSGESEAIACYDDPSADAICIAPDDEDAMGIIQRNLARAKAAGDKAVLEEVKLALNDAVNNENHPLHNEAVAASSEANEALTRLASSQPHRQETPRTQNDATAGSSSTPTPATQITASNGEGTNERTDATLPTESVNNNPDSVAIRSSERLTSLTSVYCYEGNGGAPTAGGPNSLPTEANILSILSAYLTTEGRPTTLDVASNRGGQRDEISDPISPKTEAASLLAASVKPASSPDRDADSISNEKGASNITAGITADPRAEATASACETTLPSFGRLAGNGRTPVAVAGIGEKDASPELSDPVIASVTNQAAAHAAATMAILQLIETNRPLAAISGKTGARNNSYVIKDKGGAPSSDGFGGGGMGHEGRDQDNRRFS